jgi:hypothetical protein
MPLTMVRSVGLLTLCFAFIGTVRQGYKDSNPAHASRYEQNLVRLIQSLRNDFNAPQAKFAIATVAFGGENMKGATLKVAEAQLAVSGEQGKYPEFAGNVKTVDVRSSWRNTGPGPRASYHYFNHAETFMDVGNALGWAMADLLLNQETVASSSSTSTPAPSVSASATPSTLPSPRPSPIVSE